MRLSQAGLELLSELEGFRAKRYKDQAGKWTIGFGHLLRPGEDWVSISKEEALWLLGEDVDVAERAVSDLVRIPLEQNEFDALVLFVYNVGRTAFAKSATLKVINGGRKEDVPGMLKKWVYVTVEGVKMRSDGLENRRKAEVDLWLGK